MNDSISRVSSKNPAVLAAAANSTEALINGFLNKPLARSQRSIEERMMHWADVANHPGLPANSDQSPFAIAARRKVALQSLRKLIKDHPHIAEKLQREKNSSEVSA
jgi:hypothetical protein